jgi:hypothetical protein
VETEFEIPLKPSTSLDGIISYLTKKHDGNVQDKGIVVITSKSIDDDDPRLAVRNVAGLTSFMGFRSQNEPGQWVCWDFREMRVRPTHYLIESTFIQSWVVEGSLDGSTWAEIDRQTNNQDFHPGVGFPRPLFAVSKPAKFRFIRLAQTDKNHACAWRQSNDVLQLYNVEFFGTLEE